jgi:two-component system cell cycle response regulator
VSILLDATGTSIALHGWSGVEVEEDLAQAFGLLGAHAGVALRAARMLAELEREAKQDPLTSLLNRRAFDELIDLRSAERASLALLLLDVDHFKSINDGYGHQAGDQVLQVIAQRLRSAAADVGTGRQSSVARIGGDEFAVLLTDVRLEQVAVVAERIESSMHEPVALGTSAIPVSFSIGIADTSGVWEPRELIAAADEATYQAKTHGRSRACWASGPIGESDEAASTEVDDLRARLNRSGPGPSEDLRPAEADPLISLFERSIDEPPISATTPTPPQQRPLQ